MFTWDLDCWRWIDGIHFLNYTTTKFGRDLVINRTLGTTLVADKCQGYFPCNYKIYWS